MNKRSAKKYIQYRVAEAIDMVSGTALQGIDEKTITKKIDELIGIYDTLIPEVNKEKILEKGKSKKKYFNDIFARLKESIVHVTGSKK